jgi:hypothetical protein
MLNAAGQECVKPGIILMKPSDGEGIKIATGAAMQNTKLR